MNRPSTVFTIMSPTGRRHTVHRRPPASSAGRAILTTADGHRVHIYSDDTYRVDGSDEVFQVVAGRGHGSTG